MYNLKIRDAFYPHLNSTYIKGGYNTCSCLNIMHPSLKPKTPWNS